MAVVLGLVLPRDRLAPLRSAPVPRASSAACWPAAPRTASSATRSSGTATSTGSAAGPTTSPRKARNTSTIQPPLLAWAWRIAVGDPAAEPRIAAHHRWLEANRDLDGDGLLWIVQPDESGLDSSPKFDAVWGLRAHARPLFPFLIARNRRLGWDARRVLDAGGPVLCEVVTNVLWGLARIAAGRALDHPAARRAPLG